LVKGKKNYADIQVPIKTWSKKRSTQFISSVGHEIIERPKSLIQTNSDLHFTSSG